MKTTYMSIVPKIRWFAVGAALLVGLSACGNTAETRAPQPSAPGPAVTPVRPAEQSPGPDKPPTTIEECRVAVGTFVPSIGDEPSCPAAQRSLGGIRHGIEGGLCCK